MNLYIYTYIHISCSTAAVIYQKVWVAASVLQIYGWMPLHHCHYNVDHSKKMLSLDGNPWHKCSSSFPLHYDYLVCFPPIFHIPRGSINLGPVLLFLCPPIKTHEVFTSWIISNTKVFVSASVMLANTQAILASSQIRGSMKRRKHFDWYWVQPSGHPAK